MDLAISILQIVLTVLAAICVVYAGVAVVYGSAVAAGVYMVFTLACALTAVFIGPRKD